MAHSAQHHLSEVGAGCSIHTPNTVVLIQAQTFLGGQEWFPVMPGIWIAEAIASAPWFVYAVGNFKICQKTIMPFPEAFFWNLGFLCVKYCSKLQNCKIHVWVGRPPEHSQVPGHWQRLHYPYHIYHSCRNPQASYASLNWNAQWNSLDDFLLHINESSGSRLVFHNVSFWVGWQKFVRPNLNFLGVLKTLRNCWKEILFLCSWPRSSKDKGNERTFDRCYNLRSCPRVVIAPYYLHVN